MVFIIFYNTSITRTRSSKSRTHVHLLFQSWFWINWPSFLLSISSLSTSSNQQLNNKTLTSAHLTLKHKTQIIWFKATRPTVIQIHRCNHNRTAISNKFQLKIANYPKTKERAQSETSNGPSIPQPRWRFIQASSSHLTFALSISLTEKYKRKENEEKYANKFDAHFIRCREAIGGGATRSPDGRVNFIFI